MTVVVATLVVVTCLLLLRPLLAAAAATVVAETTEAVTSVHYRLPCAEHQKYRCSSTRGDFLESLAASSPELSITAAVPGEVAADPENWVLQEVSINHQKHR